MECMTPSQNYGAAVLQDTVPTETVTVTCTSFGFKHGPAPEASLVFDARSFPNPYYVPELKEHTGLEAAVRDYVFSHADTTVFLDKIYDLLTFLLPRYAEKGSAHLTVAIGCTGGKHRSVAITEALALRLKADGLNVVTVHRDIEKN
jgi:UPF0042 nucleotide-binding protein